MRDLDKALADILAIRSQIAAGTAFHGYGPITMAVTGGLALATATGQSLLLDNPTRHPIEFFVTWAVTAVISLGIIGMEMRARSRRHHSGLEDAMIQQAIEQFLPSGAAGAVLGFMLFKFAPEALWMLPGLWQVLISIGTFASVRSLPRTVAIAGAWYFVAGFGVLVIASQDHSLSPWLMGVPFAVGQLLMAAILHFASGAIDVEA